MPFLSRSAYRFVDLTASRLAELQLSFRQLTEEYALKGTILLTPEGINLSVVGSEEAVYQFSEKLEACPEFTGLFYKDNWVDFVPFKRMLIKMKKEIITLRDPSLQPAKYTVPFISPSELKQWYDEGRDMVVLDTRNNYEYAMGRFEQAVQLNIPTFQVFPEVIQSLPEAWKDKPIVTYCTGGVRCEKGAELLERAGFKQVYQLEGGILNYFAEVGGEHYEGTCFVYDDRLTVDTHLAPVAANQCLDCESHPEAHPDCPYCRHIHDSREAATKSA